MKKLYTFRFACNGKLLFACVFVFLIDRNTVKSQTAVSSVSSNYITSTTGVTYVDNGAPNSAASANTYTYKYGNLSGTSNNMLHLNSYVVGGMTYNAIAISNSVVKMRRVNNAAVTGVRNLKSEEGNVDGSNNITLTGAYNDDMETFFNGYNNLNAGTDNLFAKRVMAMAMSITLKG